MISAILPKNIKIERLAPDELPAHLRSLAAREELQAIGSEWVKARSSAVLAVPSAVIPAETYYLLNSLHPQFAKIELAEAEQLVTDVRLLVW
jgi:RES domain-containing protein